MLDAVQHGEAFVYKSGDAAKVRRWVAALCADAAAEIRRLQHEVKELKAARLAAIAVSEIMQDELKAAQKEIKNLRGDME
jgi:hypothetical protein